MNTVVLLDHERVADGGFLLRGLLRVEADAPAPHDRVPRNLSLVLDRSRSMSSLPLQASIRAAQTLVRKLGTDDLVSVVACSDEVEVVAWPGTGPAQDHLTERIRWITSGGMTNLTSGWLRGRELVAENQTEEGVNRVLLFTGGRAHGRASESRRLVGLVRSAAESGISTSTIGFGPECDEGLLRAVALAGRGRAYRLEEVDDANGVFDEELQGLLSMSARNVRVLVRPGADAESIRVVHPYPSHAEDDTLTIEAGDLYPREPRQALLQVLLGPESERSEEVDVAEVTVEGHVLTDGGVELRTITLPITLCPGRGGNVVPELRRQALLGGMVSRSVNLR